MDIGKHPEDKVLAKIDGALKDALSQAGFIAEGYRDPQAPNAASPLGAMMAEHIRSLESDEIIKQKAMLAHPTERNVRRAVSSLLEMAKNDMSQVVKDMQKQGVLGQACSSLAEKGLSKDALGRFNRYLDLAAENAQKTQGGKKHPAFYSVDDIIKLTNAQLGNEVSEHKVQLGEGCEMRNFNPVPSRPVDKNRSPSS